MKNTTGLVREEIYALCDLITEQIPESEWRWPPVLGLYRSVVVTLTYPRRNPIQTEIAETFDVSQPTISRAVCTLTPMIEIVLREFVPTAKGLNDKAQYLVDGTDHTTCTKRVQLRRGRARPNSPYRPPGRAPPARSNRLLTTEIG